MSFVHQHRPEIAPTPADLVFVLFGDRFLARPEIENGVIFPTVEEIDGRAEISGELIHVGLLSGRSCWVATTSVAEVVFSGWQWHETRSLLTVMTPEQWQALGCARQLLWWDRRHRYCGTCGTPTVVSTKERARHCPACRAIYFPVASAAMIVAVTRGDRLLLAHNRNFRPGVYSVLAGFVDPGETLEQTVIREVREEAGIEVGELRYVTSQPWSFPNSLMVGFEARHLSGEIVTDGVEIEDARWFARDALPDIPRPGTIARLLIDRWLNRSP